jgi:hypothetical protein
MPMKFKGPAARALDAWYSTGNVTNNLTEARDLLQDDGRSFSDIIAALRTRGHTKNEFVYPAGPEVLRRPGFEPKARACYLRAIRLAFEKNPPVPIRTTWEAGAGNTDFQCHLTDGGDHVEVTISLPQGDIAPADERRLGLSHVQRY